MNAQITKKSVEKKETAVPRQPVVTVMGHIDHGKTTLLDYIRKTDVAAKEAGGITQGIAAYEVTHASSDGTKKKITFIDTPGHEAFAGIRSRGVHVADIAILVVSGEDGVKSQTLEALKFIRENKTPFIVAITKVDKPTANVERVRQSLLENGIYIEGYGGSVPSVGVSGVTGAGIDDLLEMILLVSDLEGVIGNPKKPAEGVVLEVIRSKEKGIVTVLIVKDGTLKKGMTLVAGSALSILRTMDDFSGKKIDIALSGTPVRVSGWSEMPKTGDTFVSFKTKKEAERFLKNQYRNAKTATKKNSADTKELLAVPVVVKADTAGALEAVLYEIGKLPADSIFLKVIQCGTGDINESDVKIASSSEDSVVLGFNVKIDNAAKGLAERDGVSVELFDIIYKLIERLQEILRIRTPKTSVVEIRGKAKVIRFFSSVKDKQIIGGKVLEGVIGTGDEFKIMRRGAEVGMGKIRELQQQKVKTGQVDKDREFGAMAEAKIEIAPGDVIETFAVVEK